MTALTGCGGSDAAKSEGANTEVAAEENADATERWFSLLKKETARFTTNPKKIFTLDQTTIPILSIVLARL